MILNSPLKLAILTTGRQDWGLLRPLYAALSTDQEFSPSLLVGGMACSEDYGNIAKIIRDQGFEITRELPWNAEGAGAAAQASEALELIAAALEELHPDALVLLGDRFETAAAALAATLSRVPIIHLYGGEETEGAFDNSLRHAITKMSHLHLVSHEKYAERVRQMGEDPESVHVVGSLAVDNLHNMRLPDRTALEHLLGIALTPPVGIVTVHSTTLAESGGTSEARAVVEAMRSLAISWVVTLPNCDPGGGDIRDLFEDFKRTQTNVTVVAALGHDNYLGLLSIADFVLGNSSSGVTEAPAIGVPSINIGDRQQGRLRFPSILDVPPDPERILQAIAEALRPEFRLRIKQGIEPHSLWSVVERVVEILSIWQPPIPPRKRFHER